MRKKLDSMSMTSSSSLAESVLGARTMRRPEIHHAAYVASLVALFALAGCASSDGGTPSEEAITNEEAAAGETWTGGDGAEPDEHADDGQTIDAPFEAPIFDQEETAPIDPGELDEPFACQKARGYRSGKAFTICVTTINGKLVGVNTARAYLKMRAAAKKKGVYLYIVSGFRTMAKQRQLYNLYLQGKGNLAAPPGYSNHQSGKALDLNTHASGVYSWLTKHAGAYGFRRTVPSEIWHWEH